MGRGGQYILRDHPDAVHVLLVNSMENRIQRVMERHDLALKKAAQMVQAEDKRRAVLYKKIGKTDYDHADLYDIVVNLARVDADIALDMIVELARQKDERPADLSA